MVEYDPEIESEAYDDGYTNGYKEGVKEGYEMATNEIAERTKGLFPAQSGTKGVASRMQQQIQQNKPVNDAPKGGEKPDFRVLVSKGNNLEEVAGVWFRTTKNGKKMYSGKAKKTITINEGEYINVFPKDA